MSAISKCPGFVKPVFVTAAVLGTITALAIAAIFVPPLAAVLTISSMTAAYIGVGAAIGAVATLVLGVILLKKSSSVAEDEEEKFNVDLIICQYITTIFDSVPSEDRAVLNKYIQLVHDNDLGNNKKLQKTLEKMYNYSSDDITPKRTMESDKASCRSISAELNQLLAQNNIATD